jgi:hypothetical protein
MNAFHGHRARLQGSRQRRAAGAGVAALALCAALATPGRAAEATAPQEQTRAARLFDEGLAALDQGKLELGCARLAESQALEPRVGTLLNLADCEERRGKLVVAADHWIAARELARASGDERQAEAKRRLAALEPRIPRLTLRLAASAPPTTTVKVAPVGGAAMVVRADGRPERVDPGKLRVVASAPGYADRAYDTELVAGGSESLVVDVGAPRDKGSLDERVPQSEEDRSAGGWSGLETAGAVLGGLGVVSLVVGAVLGGRAIAKQSASNEEGRCGPDNLCNQEGVDLRADAIGAARASTGTLVVGSVLVAAGVVLLLVPGAGADSPGSSGIARAADWPQVALRFGPAGLVVDGRW